MEITIRSLARMALDSDECPLSKRQGNKHGKWGRESQLVEDPKLEREFKHFLIEIHSQVQKQA